MRLQELFSADDLLVDFRPLDKWNAIDSMMASLRERGRVPEEIFADAHEAVLLRERSMSTGMERGVAIPHAAVDGLENAVATMAIIPEEHELAFESVDSSATRIIVLLLIPRSQKLLHIRTLADVARGLGKEKIRHDLFGATSNTVAWDALGD
ncbi:MAG: mannitol/fructose-specific phosphotransferase system IIA component (Ntr-type) [Planctomycetota bacterium]|jgi:mannitol/fructose-specific phosphotransferase system IIA component (Ntr-type)